LEADAAGLDSPVPGVLLLLLIQTLLAQTLPTQTLLKYSTPLVQAPLA
jgi:hypothetical protein